MKNPALAYRQMSVEGSTPLGLVAMLYDGAIAALLRAVTAIEAHDIEKKCHHLNRALAIIIQLKETLNFEQGGEVAQTLSTFYVYAHAQALKANVENSAEILRPLIEHFTALRDAWREADHRLSTQRTSPLPAGPRTGVGQDDAASIEWSVAD